MPPNRGAQPGNQNAAKEEKLDDHLHIQCWRSEKKRWRERAKAAGLSLAKWVAKRLNR
jgi:hypothetical protein